MNFNVLIVDDVAENRTLIVELMNSNFNVVCEEASNGMEAIEMAQRNCYDIILMDVMMPRLDGFQAAKEILKFDTNKNTKIIFITAHDIQREKYNDALNFGAIDYITKPINISELKRLLSVYLRFIKKEKEFTEQLVKNNLVLQDEINRSRKLEEQLIKSQENFINIVGKSNAAILIIDDNGIIKYINKSGETIFGRQENELIGESFGLVSSFENKMEINIIRKNGEIGIGELTTSRTQWENKTAWLVLINDITEHKKLQSNLEEAKEKAQESDRLKSAFLSNMSHEIRTPMNGILGFINFIDKEEDPVERRKFIEIVKICGDHLLKLINDIIDLSKIEAGQLVIKRGSWCIDNIMVEIHDFFISSSKVLDKSVKIALDIPFKGEPLYINTDGHRLKQILINLIGNALKFTEEGTIECGYLIKANYVEFFVKDSGKGISKENLETVFKRFTQVAETIDDFSEGTGLGLTISKSLVELLGGKIRVESKEGLGSTFFFTLPLVKAAPEFPATNLKCKLDHDTHTTLKDKTILIAEDVENNYKLIENIFRDIGVATLRARNGDEAIEISKKQELDLILMDIKMPFTNGLEATRKIRESNKTIPIIAHTAYALEGEMEKCIDAGCTDYVSKPIVKDELLKKICNVFN